VQKKIGDVLVGQEFWTAVANVAGVLLQDLSELLQWHVLSEGMFGSAIQVSAITLHEFSEELREIRRINLPESRENDNSSKPIFLISGVQSQLSHGLNELGVVAGDAHLLTIDFVDILLHPIVRHRNNILFESS
jgi:hypothetical protein